MSNAYDEFLSDEPAKQDLSEGGVLRNKLENAIKLLREKDKQIAELAKANASRVVEDFLAKSEVPAKFHKLAKKELGDSPDEAAFKSFLEEYGDLWGAEPDEEPKPEVKQLQDGLEKMEAARREAYNIKDNTFKIPSRTDLSRMNEDQLAELIGKMNPS